MNWFLKEFSILDNVLLYVLAISKENYKWTLYMHSDSNSQIMIIMISVSL